MDINISQLAASITTMLAPFTPFLVEGGKKFASEVGQAGGEKAIELWGKIRARFKGDKDISKAAQAVAIDPENEDFQALLSKALVARLKDTPDFAEELLAAIGGQEVVQKVLAERGSWVEDVTQEMDGGGGTQTVAAKSDSVIKGVKQSVKR